MDTMINWNDIDLPDDCYAECLITTFKIHNYRNIEDLEIKIWETGNPNEPYRGDPSHEFWGPLQFGPYESVHGGRTLESAFNRAMSTYTGFDRSEYPNEVVFFVKWLDGDRQYYDGNGQLVDPEDVQPRRDKFRRENPNLFPDESPPENRK